MRLTSCLCIYSVYALSLLNPVHPLHYTHFLPPVFLRHLATSAQIRWIRCRNAAGILIRTYLHGDNEASSSDLSFRTLILPTLPPHVFMLLSYDLYQEHWCPIREMNNWPCLEWGTILYSRVLRNGAWTSYLLWRTSRLSMPTHNQLLLTLSPRLLMHPFRSGLLWPTPSVPIYSNKKWSC